MKREKRDTGQGISSAQIQQIQQLAETIRYGSITLVFQDGVLIQIEKAKKSEFRTHKIDWTNRRFCVRPEAVYKAPVFEFCMAFFQQKRETT